MKSKSYGILNFLCYNLNKVEELQPVSDGENI